MRIELESFPPEKRRGFTVFLIAILIVIVGTAADYWEKKKRQSLRVLSLEEQETVHAAIDRTAVQYRLSKELIKALRSRVSNPALPAFIDMGIRHPLLQEDQKILLFSPKFFEADPISQERSLMALAK